MKIAVLFAAAGVAVFLTACGPELAQTPYTQEETEWMGYLQQHYPGWRPPQTTPPSASTAAPAVVNEPKATGESTLTYDDADGESFEFVSENNYNGGAYVDSETQAPEAAAPGYTEYTVKKGDTLGGIAQRFYNKSSRWKQIYNANTNVISDPNKLKIGTVLRIPQAK